MTRIEFPVLNVRMIPINKIRANDYNPNKVATPEMKLLKHSIEEDGYTQPVVCYYDESDDMYEIVDGFHRYTVAIKYFDLKEIPCTIINKSIENRMASTIRHNRARGTHQINNMSEIVVDLSSKGWTDIEICNHLGMDLDEVIRLKQVSGLKEAFANHEFSKSWVEFKEKIDGQQNTKITN
jgi:ParB-like chromosome segregation protein Spo0J